MKSNIKYLEAFCIYFGALVHAYAQGYIVPNGVSTFNGPGYGISVTYNPVAGDATGFTLDPQGKTPPTSLFTNTYRFNPIVDVGVRVFLVLPNASISLQPILSMNYTELTYPNNYVFNPGTPFYVGFYTGNQPFAPQNGIYSDPLFGWAELENVNGTIQLLNSALEYQGGGIIAGTQTILPVPEPETWSLLLCGAVCFVARRLYQGRGSTVLVRGSET